LVAMTSYSADITDETKARSALSYARLFTNPDIFSVSLSPLPADFQPFMIANGKRYEPSNPPAGVVTISYRQKPNGLTSEQIPYAEVDGNYRLVSIKSSPLPWSGPPDVNIGFFVVGNGANRVETKARYNASGVDVSQFFTAPSASLAGQYFSEIVV